MASHLIPGLADFAQEAAADMMLLTWRQFHAKWQKHKWFPALCAVWDEHYKRGFNE